MGLTLVKGLEDIFSEFEVQAKRKANVVECTFADDPIALSWASYHVWTKFPERRWVSLNDVEAHSHDREMAAETRRYYKDKLMMQTLRGRAMSEYQTLLYGIVTGEAPIMSDQTGIIMKLPYFYVEDQTLNSVFENTRAVTGEQQLPTAIREGTITPRARVFSSRKNHETYQYWFSDTDNHSVLWSVNAQNPLKGLVDSLYRRSSPLDIRAHWFQKKHFQTGRTFFNLTNVELV